MAAVVLPFHDAEKPMELFEGGAKPGVVGVDDPAKRAPRGRPIILPSPGPRPIGHVVGHPLVEGVHRGTDVIQRVRLQEHQTVAQRLEPLGYLR